MFDALQLRQTVDLFVSAEDVVHPLAGELAALPEFFATTVENRHQAVKQCDCHGDRSDGVVTAKSREPSVDSGMYVFPVDRIAEIRCHVRRPVTEPK
jgi:hypothetical protein